MTVQELLDRLSVMPRDAEVLIEDGQECMPFVGSVLLNEDGAVVLDETG